MTANIDAFVKDIRDNFPEFLRPSDLVNSGLFQSRSDVCHAMRRAQAPPYIKLSSHKVVFPRASLCEWLREKMLVAGGLQDEK